MDKGDGSIKYILTGEGAGTTFTIDDSTGDIHAIQRLDREVKAQYILRAQARNRLTDRPLEPESEFIVKIQDINDNEPKFLDGPYHASVPEMSQIGKQNEKVRHANNKVYKSSSSCSYRIILICFITTQKATFVVNKPNINSWPHMENSTEIYAYPQPLVPSLPHLWLCDYPGTSVIQLTATDADDPTYGNSARVVYSILEGQPYFSVDAKTGTDAHMLKNPQSVATATRVFILYI